MALRLRGDSLKFDSRKQNLSLSLRKCISRIKNLSMLQYTLAHDMPNVLVCDIETVPLLRQMVLVATMPYSNSNAVCRGPSSRSSLKRSLR